MAFNVAIQAPAVSGMSVALGARPTILNTFVSVVRTEGGFLALYKGEHPCP